MPLPLRIESAGACFHWMFRGNARMPVFRDEEDREQLLDRMAHFAGLFRVRIRAYCIMLPGEILAVRTGTQTRPGERQHHGRRAQTPGRAHDR